MVGCLRAADHRVLGMHWLAGQPPSRNDTVEHGRGRVRSVVLQALDEAGKRLRPVIADNLIASPQLDCAIADRCAFKNCPAETADDIASYDAHHGREAGGEP